MIKKNYNLFVGGGSDNEGTEAASRAWRGAGAAPVRDHLHHHQPSTTTTNGLLLLAVLATIYVIATVWKRYGRRFRRRKILSLAT